MADLREAAVIAALAFVEAREDDQKIGGFGVFRDLRIGDLRATIDALSTSRARSEALEKRQDYASAVQPYAVAMQMVREAIGELFGPLANLESEEAELLRGPEPNHTAEAFISALQNVASQLLELGELREQAARYSAALEQISVLSDHISGPDLTDPCLTVEDSWGNSDDAFINGRRQAFFEAASIARAALSLKQEGKGKGYRLIPRPARRSEVEPGTDDIVEALRYFDSLALDNDKEQRK